MKKDCCPSFGAVLCCDVLLWQHVLYLCCAGVVVSRLHNTSARLDHHHHQPQPPKLAPKPSQSGSSGSVSTTGAWRGSRWTWRTCARRWICCWCETLWTRTTRPSCEILHRVNQYTTRALSRFCVTPQKTSAMVATMAASHGTSPRRQTCGWQHPLRAAIRLKRGACIGDGGN